MEDLETQQKAEHAGILEHLDEELEKVESTKRKHHEIANMLGEDNAGHRVRFQARLQALNEAREQQQKIVEGWTQLHQRNIHDNNKWRHELGHMAAKLQQREAAVRFSVFSSLSALCCGWFLCVCGCVNLSSCMHPFAVILA